MPLFLSSVMMFHNDSNAACETIVAFDDVDEAIRDTFFV